MENKSLLRTNLLTEFRVQTFVASCKSAATSPSPEPFAEGTIPAAFSLVESTAAPGGVILVHYNRDGEVRTGTMELKEK